MFVLALADENCSAALLVEQTREAAAQTWPGKGCVDQVSHLVATGDRTASVGLSG